MRKSTLLLAVMAASALGVNAAAKQVQTKGTAEEGTDSTTQQVQQQQGAGQKEGTKVSGIVTAADTQTQEITIDGETYVMPKEGWRGIPVPTDRRRSYALLRGTGWSEGHHPDRANAGMIVSQTRQARLQAARHGARLRCAKVGTDSSRRLSAAGGLAVVATNRG
jgi:hypothetical protein